jgi:2-methylcitrate dehydratase PrpD
VSARDAALINGTLALGLDYEDRNHSSTYSLATAIAAAEESDLSGATALEAFIIRRDVRNSLDPLFGKRSSGIGPGARGWHSNGVLGPIASACSASKALGLNLRQTLAAIGLAGGSCGALTRDGGTMAKPFRTGQAAATGLTCALLARSGFTSDETVLEGRYGLLEALGPVPDDILHSLGRELGSKFNLQANIRIKPYSSCTATHSGLEAMLRLIRKQPIAPEAVEFIDCDLKPYPLVRQRPQRGFEGRFSMSYCLAMMLIYRKLDPGDFTDEHVNNSLVQELMSRIRHTPEAPSLIVALKNGARFEEALQSATDLEGWGAIKDKFKSCVHDVSADLDTEKIPALVSQLESLSSIRLLTKALQTRRT